MKLGIYFHFSVGDMLQIEKKIAFWCSPLKVKDPYILQNALISG